MRAWLAAVRLGAVHRFAWRFEALVAIVSAVAVVVVNASLWTRGAVPGLGPGDIATYTVVAWLVAAACGGRVEEHVGERFRTGEIAADLLRPLDLPNQVLARHLGRAGASLALTAVPVFALMALWFPVALPGRPLVFAASVVLAAVVGGEVGFLVGLAAFRLGRVEGVAHLKAAAIWLLSGALIPVDALPRTARSVALALPFQAIAHVPATLFLGGDPWLLVGQAGWAAVLAIAARLAWIGARRRLVVMGG